MNDRRQTAGALLAVVLMMCPGCGGNSGPELAEVTGTVTLDGQPLPRINLQFVPDTPGGSPSYGGTNADGQYRLAFSQDQTGAMLGRHRVDITVQDPEVDDNGNLVPGQVPPKIARKYFQPGALTAEIKSGDNTVDFALTSK